MQKEKSLNVAYLHQTIVTQNCAASWPFHFFVFMARNNQTLQQCLFIAVALGWHQGELQYNFCVTAWKTLLTTKLNMNVSCVRINLQKRLRRVGGGCSWSWGLNFPVNESIMFAVDKNCIIKLKRCGEPNLLTYHGLCRMQSSEWWKKRTEKEAV